MIAVDTNVVVRFLVAGDDLVQAARASDLFQANTVHVSGSVLLETAWVLRRNFGFDRSQIGMAFGLLLGLANVRVENAGRVVRAMSWVDGGLDVADAMHLIATPAGAEFMTFDRTLVRRASSLPDTPVARLA